MSEPMRTMQPWLPTQPADVGTERATPANVIALVNGLPIDRAELIEMLIEGHGLRALEQLVLLTAARQRAAEMSLTVTEADVQAAHEDALRKLGTPVSDPDGPVLDREAAQRLLDQFLAAKNISRPEWNCRMQQRAYLGKIAEAEVKQVDVTDEMLEKEYDLAEPTEENVFEMTEGEREERGIEVLPGSLIEAIHEAEGSELLRRCLGDHVFDSLIANKKIEWDQYRKHVSEFETRRYMPIL